MGRNKVNSSCVTHYNCRNPSIWLATKARGLQGCGLRSRPGSQITCSRECKEYKECEGVNPDTPKWTPMLRVGESWSPKRTPEISESVLRDQNSMAWCALYINGKILKCRCLKWARIAHLDIWNTSYGQKKARESNSRESNSRESASFDSRPLKVGNRPETLSFRERATYRWKGLDETYNFSSDGNSIGGLLRKLWWFKVAGVQSCAISGLLRGSPRSPGTKSPFGCHLRDESQSIL
jgi:hypothetical protein